MQSTLNTLSMLLVFCSLMLLLGSVISIIASRFCKPAYKTGLVRFAKWGFVFGFVVGFGVCLHTFELHLD